MNKTRFASALVLVLGACNAAGSADSIFWDPTNIQSSGGNGMIGAPAGNGGDSSSGGDTSNPAGAGGVDTSVGAGGMDTGVGAGGSDTSQGTGGQDTGVGAGGMDTGVGAGGMSAGTGGAAPTGCSVSVSFNELDDGGKYRPRNVGAIWVTDGSGTFLRTLTVWAGQRAKYLKAWVNASNGSKVDAVSSATKSSQGARSATWNCDDLSGNPVPNGAYQIHAEMTEADTTGPNTEMDITLNGQPFDMTFPDEQYFTSRQVIAQ